MEEKSKSYIDEKGFIWQDIGDGIRITNYDGSPPVFPDDLKSSDNADS